MGNSKYAATHTTNDLLFDLDPERSRTALNYEIVLAGTWHNRFRESLKTLEERFPVRWPFHLYYLREKAKETSDASERWWLRLRRKIEQRATVKG